MTKTELEEKVKSLADHTSDELQIHSEEVHFLCSKFLTALNLGVIRSAEKVQDSWEVNSWVKDGILLCFRLGKNIDASAAGFPFFDKDTLPLRPMSLEDGVRVVPGGSAIRTGCFVARSVICMPPMYINIGAYVDEGSMIDSHALVGTCAQVGKRVHISAAAQIGGVLEPAGARPVIVEDDVLIGGNCGVYEGVLIRARAVLGSGVILNASTPVYDLVHNRILRSTDENSLEIPEGAVVVAGSRRVSGEFAEQFGLSISTPLIVKYRDEKTSARTALESALR